MSERYTADGRRKSSMTHAKHVHECRCGRVINGNSYHRHKKYCEVWLAHRAALEKVASS